MKKIIFIFFFIFFFFGLRISVSPPVSLEEISPSSFLVLGISFVLGGEEAYARDAKKKRRGFRKKKRKNKEVDVSDIAEQYWRPQRDSLGVIQGRRFRKAERLELSLLYGFYQSRQYTDSSSYGFSLVYNLNERWALDASYMRVQNTDSQFLREVREELKDFSPDFNREKSHGIFAISWSPIYAKFAFLGKKISHFETYLSLGLGFTETTKFNFTYSVTIGERFYLSRNFLFRVEWRVSAYTDDDITVTDLEGKEVKRSDSIRRANLILGLGWLF